MFKPVRVVATLILLGAIAMTFMGAFLLNNAVLCLVMVIVEYLAYIWYSLSYIPYARTVSSCRVGEEFTMTDAFIGRW